MGDLTKSLGDFDANWLILSLIPSAVGFVLFVYGKKQQRIPHMVAGVLLSVYPYFTESIASLVGVGLALGVAFWVALWMGY